MQGARRRWVESHSNHEHGTIPMNGFVHLNVHSHYSRGWGIPGVEDLCRAARVRGMDTLALTDTNGLYGLVPFLDAARESGVRPVVGSELVAGPHRAVLLVRDDNGYANLCRLISARHCDPEFDLTAALRVQRKGLIVISDDTEVLKGLRKDGTRDLFVEVSPGHGMARCIAFSRRSGIPPAATNRACLLDRDQFPLHRILRAVALNTKLSRLTPADIAREHNILCSPRDMIERFPHAPQAIRNTLRAVEQCKTEWPPGRLVFPRFKSMGDDEAFERLRRLTLEGCRRRYGRITRTVRERVAHEMGIIREKNFAHYFLVVADIIRRAPRSCGRGSAAASIVAYALGITHVDPIRHNLFFERFLNPGREDPPDIDVDFAWDEREQVMDYVFARYGHGRAAMVANHNTYGARSAIREVAKVFGLPDEEIGRVTGKIGFGWRLREVWEGLAAHPRMRGLRFDPPWDGILAAAVRLEDHLNHLSVHCGGVVIVPDEVRRYCPVEISSGGVQVLQWEKDAVEEAGLIKIDLLGNRSLAVIRDALAMVERNTGRRIDYAGWDPVDDPETLKIFYRGETMGVFYFESPATRQVLVKVASGFTLEEYIRQNHFLLNVVVTSIIRPASNHSIRDWVTRLHGAPWDVPHPRLRPVLQETLGVMVFQEQLSRAAIHLAGFDPAEADTLRKVVSKKHREKKLRDFHQRFIRGAVENGVPLEVARDTWDMMMGFDGYSFCKPHSASYTLVAYKSAWLRAHYPAEFMAAVVSNGGGYYSVFGYLSEARRMGLTLLPPDVNESDIAYTGKGRAVRVGFMQLRDLHREAGEALVRERDRNGPFASFASFLDRTTPHIRFQDARVLIRAGCFDRIEGGDRRPVLLWQALRFFDRDEAPVQARLFGPRASGRGEKSHLAGRPLDLETRIRNEVETLGFPLTVHPLKRYGNIFERTPRCPAKDLASRVGRTVTLVGWPVTGKTVHSRRGDPMKFVTFEDETGLYETVFFPREYRRFCHMLGKSRAYVLRGRVEEDLNAITVTVGWIGFLDQRAPGFKRTLPLPEALPGPPG
ncbi:MAG: DNA polymerase III subunit alpha [Thermodesulfobacteriota bacterium]